ncbi:MAG: hypothetical protein PHD48_02765 [Alphaproteobacteria bacterium]|nr:hypothetical protein [Alphaproteobacteria bacterium]
MSFPHLHTRPLPPLPAIPSKAGKLAFCILALAPFLFGLLALYLGQDTNWDLRNYHWYNAYALLNGRYDLDLLPSQIPYFYNPALDVPYFLLATHVSAKVATLLLGSVQGINFILIFMLCHATLIIPNPRQKVWVCTLLAALGMLGGGGIAQIGTTFYDNITSLGLFSSTLLTLRFFSRMMDTPSWKRSLGMAALCGFPAGLMMGFKLPFVIFCVALCGALLLVTGPLKRRVWIAFGFGLGVLLGLMLTLGPWAWHLQARFGSPLFPYFNNVFHSPLTLQSSMRDVQFIPSSWSDRLFFPIIFTAVPWRVGEIPWRDLRIPILYFLLPLCVMLRLLFGRNKNAPDKLTSFYASRYLLWTCVLSYIVWLFLFSIYRYIIPLEMLAPLLIVIVMSLLPLRPSARAILTSVLLLIIAATIVPGNWGRRQTWLDQAVQVTAPPLPDSESLMILMAGFEPYSHVLASFPPHIAFVRIQSNFSSPDEPKGINQVIKDRVTRHKGSFKLLIPNFQMDHAVTALTYFNLKVVPQTCQAVEDHLYDSRLELCDIRHVTTSGSP